MKIQINSYNFLFKSVGHVDVEEYLLEIPKIQEMGCMLNNAVLGKNPNDVHVPDDAIQRMLHIAEIIYDFAVNGVVPDESLDTDSLFLDFLAFCLAANAAEELFAVHSCSDVIQKMMAMSILRNRLNSAVLGMTVEAAVLEPQCDYFTLNEITVLGQIHEKTARNATQERAVDRLVTFKDGAKTLVTATEAARWLGNRRNFKPTQLIGKR